MTTEARETERIPKEKSDALLGFLVHSALVP